MIKRVLIVGLGVALCGCATYRNQSPATGQTFNAPESAVWTIVVAEVGIDYPILDADKENGLLTSQTVPVPLGNWNTNKVIRRWVLSPGPNLMMGYSGLRVRVSAQVSEPQAGATHIEVRAHYEGFEGPMGSYYGKWVALSSNGALEREILERIAQKIASRS
jgi:hypothetical protein